jgi:hypothetical protein
MGAINSHLAEVAALHRRPIDLKKAISSSDIKTCISISQRVPEDQSNDLGSILDHVELANKFDFDLREPMEFGSSGQSFFGGRGNGHQMGGSSQEELYLSSLDFARTFSNYSLFKKSEVNKNEFL